MDCSHQSVDLNRIDLEDETFRISAKGLIPDSNGDANASLASSIKRIGLIHPPQIIQVANKYQVVYGFERIKICRQLGWETIPCVCLSPQTPSSECVLISIAEAVSQHGLNMVEKANVVKMVAEIFPSMEKGLDDARLVGFDLNAQMAEKLLKVHEFNQLLKLGLIQDRIGLPTAFRIEKITGPSEADGLVLSEFMAALNVSLTRQKEILDYIETICHRDGITIVDLLTDAELKKLIDDDQLDGPQKSNRIREVLKRRCYPKLTFFDAHYQKAIKKVAFNQGVSFSPPPQFEGRNFSLRIEFSTGNELRQKVQDIDRLIASAGFQELISPRYRTESK